jgi:hypothetical protein
MWKGGKNKIRNDAVMLWKEKMDGTYDGTT